VIQKRDRAAVGYKRGQPSKQLIEPNGWKHHTLLFCDRKDTEDFGKNK
jgi:hypothetical protein